MGQKLANAFGLHDMSGNVWEWTCSRYNKVYGGDEQRCTGTRDTGTRVLRGGSWGLEHVYARAANRLEAMPEVRYDGRGFRLAQSELDLLTI